MPPPTPNRPAATPARTPIRTKLIHEGMPNSRHEELLRDRLPTGSARERSQLAEQDEPGDAQERRRDEPGEVAARPRSEHRMSDAVGDGRDAEKPEGSQRQPAARGQAAAA